MSKRSKKERLRQLREWHNAFQGNFCALCFQPMGEDVTLDHTKPRAMGGGNTRENTRAVHNECNQRRGCTPDHKFFAENAA